MNLEEDAPPKREVGTARLAIVGLALLLAVAASTGVWFATRAESHRLEIILEVHDLPGTGSSIRKVDNDGCQGNGAYAGLRQGAPLDVMDEPDGVLASQPLPAGELLDGAESPAHARCRFTVHLDVPDARSYWIGTPLGAYGIDDDELEANEWSVTVNFAPPTDQDA